MENVQRNILRSTILPLVSSTGMSFVAYTAYQYLFFPKVGEITQIYDFCILMGIEIIFVCLNVALSALATRRTILYWFGILLFFIPFIYIFSTLMIDPTPMKGILTCIVICHIIDALTLTKEGAEQASGWYAIRLMFYVFLLIFCCVFSKDFPECGLTSSFLQEANYESIKKIKGVIADKPHVIVTFGLLYYGIWSLGKLYFNIVALFNPRPVLDNKVYVHAQGTSSSNQSNKKRKKWKP